MSEKLLNKKAQEAINAFGSDLTYVTFCKMCDIVYKSYEWQCQEWQCQDTLSDVAWKIPLLELEKIIELITNPGQSDICDACEISITTIINSHIVNWFDMSTERFECLFLHMNDSFWESIVDRGPLRHPKEMRPSSLRAVLDTILKHK